MKKTKASIRAESKPVSNLPPEGVGLKFNHPLADFVQTKSERPDQTSIFDRSSATLAPEGTLL